MLVAAVGLLLVSVVDYHSFVDGVAAVVVLVAVCVPTLVLDLMFVHVVKQAMVLLLKTKVRW